MKYVFTVFIDGLSFNSLEHMPFLNSFTNKRKIWTELGYSTTCHPSIYTGVYPNKHMIWFMWKYAPHTSPFKWIDKLKLNKLPDNIFIKYLLYKITRLFTKSTAYFGTPIPGYIPLQNWHYFDVCEKKLWNEPGYLDNYPTIFEILKKYNVEYDVVQLPVNVKDSYDCLKEHNKALKDFNPDKIKPWTYFFIGDVDLMCHHNGKDSEAAQSLLKEIDAILEQKFLYFQKKIQEFTFIVLSDHGFIDVQEEINIADIFNSAGKRLDNYIFSIESNYARFWFRNAKEKEEICELLLNLSDKGFILTPDLIKSHNINMPDNRYGDMVFYLDAPYIFDRGHVVIAGKQVDPHYLSMHGYRPDYPGYAGCIVSNKELVDEPYIKLVDIMPSILYELGLPIPAYVDGRIIWK